MNNSTPHPSFCDIELPAGKGEFHAYPAFKIAQVEIVLEGPLPLDLKDRLTRAREGVLVVPSIQAMFPGAKYVAALNHGAKNVLYFRVHGFRPEDAGKAVLVCRMGEAA